MELRRINGTWETEAGKRLEIEAVSVTPTVADGIVAIEMPLPVPKAVAATQLVGLTSAALRATIGPPVLDTLVVIDL